MLTSVAQEYLGAGVDAPGVSHDQFAILAVQERGPDLTRPDDEVPQTIELLNDDVNLRVPPRCCIPARFRVTAALRFTIAMPGAKFPTRLAPLQNNADYC